MCNSCVAHEHKLGPFERALTQALDQLTADRITLALREMQDNRPVCREAWRIGQRVSRTDSDRRGTVTKEGEILRVDWDIGATSYYAAHKPANVRLDPEK